MSLANLSGRGFGGRSLYERRLSPYERHLPLYRPYEPDAIWLTSWGRPYEIIVDSRVFETRESAAEYVARVLGVSRQEADVYVGSLPTRFD
jgi:hypothetical protein